MPKKLAVGKRKAAMAGKRSATKRELIDTGAEGRGLKRTAKGRLKETDDTDESGDEDGRRG